MTRFLTRAEVAATHAAILVHSGGAAGLRDENALESALAQPRMAFSGQELYPSLSAKAAALGYSLIANHPFVDGNKRIGHAAMEILLVLNGCELDAPVSEQEDVVLRVAAGTMSREELATWIEAHLRPRAS